MSRGNDGQFDIDDRASLSERRDSLPRARGIKAARSHKRRKRVTNMPGMFRRRQRRVDW